MKISEIITDKYKLRIPPTVYYELLADVVEAEEKQEPTTKNNLGIDAISRQQAIERLKLNFPISDGADNSRDRHRYMQAMADIQAIREMPSVTPQEPQSFEWCTDCKEYDQEKHCCHRWSKVIRDTVEEMKQEQEPKTGHWIGHREHCENLGVMPSVLGAYEWCSNCDCGIDVREWHRNHYNYCPNCGAKMVEPQESEEV